MKFKDYLNKNYIGLCVVRKASIRQTSAGKPYADLQLFDGDEQVMGRVWDFYGDLPEEDSIIKVDGNVTKYNDRLQITIGRFKKAAPGEYNPADFMPTCEGDRDQMLSQLKEIVQQIKSPDIKTMVESVLENFSEEYYNAPAAVTNHHNYLGGLLKHTLMVTKTALFLAESQDQAINKDLVIAGSVLHDVGKIQAYSWSGSAIKRSEDGIMIDHIPLGMMMLKPYVDKHLDDVTGQHLLHIIVSHHGTKEWGSPVEPKTQEATIVHLADLADARLNTIR